MQITSINNVQLHAKNVSPKSPSFQARIPFNKIEQFKFDKFKSAMVNCIPNEVVPLNTNFIVNKYVFKFKSLFDTTLKPLHEILVNMQFSNKNTKFFKEEMLKSQDDYEFTNFIHEFKKAQHEITKTADKELAQFLSSVRPPILPGAVRPRYITRIANMDLKLSSEKLNAMKDATTLDEVGRIHLKYQRAAENLRELIANGEPNREWLNLDSLIDFSVNNDIDFISHKTDKLLKERFPNIVLDEADKVPIEDIYKKAGYSNLEHCFAAIAEAEKNIMK